MTRLRRSLRGGAAEAVSQEERHEKLIRYIADPQYQDNLRQFHMPTYILANATQSTTTKSRLLSLGNEILINIIDNLEGNDQISVSLTCKILAAVAEASDTRKIANISSYLLSSADPAEHLRRKVNPWNFVPPPVKDPTPEELFAWQSVGFDPSTWANTYAATNEQHEALREMVGEWLGPSFRFCWRCRKYRVNTKSFWLSFAEYENAGITKRASENVMQAINDWYDGTKIRKVAPDSAYLAVIICPAHDLLAEMDGVRVIELTDGERNAQLRKDQKRKRVKRSVKEIELWK